MHRYGKYVGYQGSFDSIHCGTYEISQSVKRSYSWFHNTTSMKPQIPLSLRIGRILLSVRGSLPNNQSVNFALSVSAEPRAGFWGLGTENDKVYDTLTVHHHVDFLL